MNLRRITFLLVLIAATTLGFAASPQEKAQRELSHISALASDASTRAVVNEQVAKVLGQERAKVVDERKELHLSYGNLYLISELTKNNTSFDDIAAQIKAGKSVTDIANAQNADWKKIANDVKAFQKTLQNALVASMENGGKATTVSAPAKPDAYNARADWFDFDGKSYDNDDLAWALTTFSAARERAANLDKKNGDPSELDYNRLHGGVDHIKDGLKGGSSAGNPAPSSPR